MQPPGEPADCSFQSASCQEHGFKAAPPKQAQQQAEPPGLIAGPWLRGY